MAPTSHILPGIHIASHLMNISTFEDMSVSIADGKGDKIHLEQAQFLELMRLSNTIVRVDYD